MQPIRLPAVTRPAVAHGSNGRVLSVSADAPVEMVLALLVSRQLPAVAVVDEYGVPVGVVSLSNLMSRTGGDPIFAGHARRRWYDLPAAALARDVMVPAAPKLARAEPALRLPVAS